MRILIISLFIAMVSQPYIKQWIRTALSLLLNDPIEYWMTKFIKPIDCTPCFTWWTAVIVSIISYTLTNQIEYLPAMTAFVVATLFSKS